MDSRKVHFAVAAVPRFDAAATSVECSIIMIGPHDEPGIPVFGYSASLPRLKFSTTI